MADWNEKIANPDTRVKWAMDVMDQEGQDFEGITGKALTPLSAALMIPVMTVCRNAMTRVPIRTGMIPVLLAMPVFGLIGQQLRNWVDNGHREEEAVMRHYILTHPELFPEPKRVKYIDHIEAFRPIRW